MRLYRLSAIVLAIACASTAAAQEPPAKRTFPERYEVPKTAAEVWAILDDVEVYASDKRLRGDPPGAMFTALAAVRDVKLVPAAGERLFVSKEWLVKVICVRMLAQMDSPQSTGALLRFVKSLPTLCVTGEKWDKTITELGLRDEVDRWMFVGSMEASLKTLIARGKFNDIRADLKRLRAPKLMPEAGPPGVELLIEFARETAKDEDLLRVCGQEIYWAFALLRRDDCLPLLRATAADETLPERPRTGALRGLIDGWGAKEYETVLAVAKSSKDRTVRDLAWYAAVKLDSAKARLEILNLLHNNVFVDGNYWVVRRLAIRLLGACRDPRDVPQLAAFLDDEKMDSNTKLAALIALWNIEHVRRDSRGLEPYLEKEYRDYMEKNPAPDKDTAK